MDGLSWRVQFSIIVLFYYLSSSKIWRNNGGWSWLSGEKEGGWGLVCQGKGGGGGEIVLNSTFNYHMITTTTAPSLRRVYCTNIVQTKWARVEIYLQLKFILSTLQGSNMVEYKIQKRDGNKIGNYSNLSFCTRIHKVLYECQGFSLTLFQKKHYNIFNKDMQMYSTCI